MKFTGTTFMVIISILIHVGIFVGIGRLVYVFSVKYPEQIEKRHLETQERLWLNSAVEEIKAPDGSTEALIRIKMPESILKEATNSISAPKLKLQSKNNEKHDH